MHNCRRGRGIAALGVERRCVNGTPGAGAELNSEAGVALRVFRAATLPNPNHSAHPAGDIAYSYQPLTRRDTACPIVSGQRLELTVIFGGGKKKQIASLHKEGVAFFEAGEYGEAVKRFAKLNDLEPTSERLYYMGVLFDLMGHGDGSLSALRESIRLDPGNSQARFSLATVLYQKDNIEGAFEAAQQAYETNSEDFRILNLYARLMIESPYTDHQNPKLAFRLSEKACKLTDWQDDVCITTHAAAKAALGGNRAKTKEEKRPAPTQETGDEVIAHFEKRFKKKANPRSLQNIVPNHVPVSVHTIETGKGVSVIFTNGMSSVPAPASKKGDLKLAELYMIMPSDHEFPVEVNESVWPWHHLQLLAFRPHVESGACFSRSPQVTTIGDAPEPFTSSCDFAAYLLLPNVKGYVDACVLDSEAKIEFLLAMPIYHEEYELALQEGGIARLFRRLRDAKLKPYYKPGRKNLAVS